MPDDIPNYEPDLLVAGDTATWRRTLGNYPASQGWVITYALVQQKTGLQILITGTADGDDHLINVPPSVTAAWSDGDYAGSGYCTKSPDRFTIWRGTITISTDLAGATPGDPRTHGRIVLDAIEAVLEGRANQDCQRIVIADTLLIKYPVADLLMLRDRYVVIVRKEEDRAKIASGRRTGRRILTRFRAANQSPFTARGQSGDIR
jgi:hypothetical protein